ncbi:MAG: asparaginase [Ardenticatenaceae bacterium]|nr:asparaginase [Ardenticatenaceae bacterium]
MARDKVVVITTGGTIAMRDEGEGAVPAIAGKGLVRDLPSDVAALGDIEVEEFSNLPSAHLTVDQLWNLQKTVVDRLERLYVRGVVVTHGTDTMEETAYLLDLTVPVSRPIVLTGAMRTAGEPGYDGRANLLAAIRVAFDPNASERGTMIVMNDEIHAARYATKAHTSSPAAFQSPGWGPMGRVYTDEIQWGWDIKREVFPVRQIEPNVHLIVLTVGANESILRYLIERRVRGVVIETLGGGRVPPWWVAPIKAAVAAGIAVVVTSRTGAGRTVDRYGYPGAYRDLEEAGVIFAGELNGPKARIKLMAALGARG